MKRGFRARRRGIRRYRWCGSTTTAPIHSREACSFSPRRLHMKSSSHLIPTGAPLSASDSEDATLTVALRGGHTFHVVLGSGEATARRAIRSTARCRGVGCPARRHRPGARRQLRRSDRLEQVREQRSLSDLESYGDGEVTFAGLDISGSFVWVEGITVRNQMYGLAAIANPTDVVVRRSSFLNNHYSILMEEGGRNLHRGQHHRRGHPVLHREPRRRRHRVEHDRWPHSGATASPTWPTGSPIRR